MALHRDLVQIVHELDNKQVIKALGLAVNKTDELVANNKDLNREYTKLNRNLKETSKGYAEKRKRIDEIKEEVLKNSRAIAENEKKIRDEAKAMDAATISSRQLKTYLSALKNEYEDLTPGTKEYIHNLKEQSRIQEEVARRRITTGKKTGILDSISQNIPAAIAGAFAGGAVTLGIAGIDSVISSITNLASRTADLSDQFSDIKKTTNLTSEEVQRLNSSFKDFDTRTPSEELRKLASEAGKLGIDGYERIRKFVDEANKINVALGEDLGKDAVIQIQKISDAFNVGALQTASAINSLGASSAASEGYLVEFGSRLAGTAKTAKISVPDMLSYGAVFDSLNLNVESSATALQLFFTDFIKNNSKFEKAAGMTKGSLQKLIGEKGTNEGFLAFIEALKNSSSSSEDFLKKLDDLGIDGARGSAVFLTLAENTQKVREQQAIANTEFEKGTSIIDEYNEKNNNLAGLLERLKKNFSSAFNLGAAEESLKKIVSALLDFTNAGSPAVKITKLFVTFIGETISAVLELADSFVGLFNSGAGIKGLLTNLGYAIAETVMGIMYLTTGVKAAANSFLVLIEYGKKLVNFFSPDTFKIDASRTFANVTNAINYDLKRIENAFSDFRGKIKDGSLATKKEVIKNAADISGSLFGGAAPDKPTSEEKKREKSAQKAISQERKLANEILQIRAELAYQEDLLLASEEDAKVLKQEESANKKLLSIQHQFDNEKTITAEMHEKMRLETELAEKELGEAVLAIRKEYEEKRTKQYEASVLKALEIERNLQKFELEQALKAAERSKNPTAVLGAKKNILGFNEEAEAAALALKYQQEQEAAKDNAAALLIINENYERELQLLRQKYRTENADLERTALENAAEDEYQWMKKQIQNYKEQQDEGKERIQAVLDTVSTSIDAIGGLYDAALQRQIAAEQRQHEERLAQLEEQKEKGILTEEEYAKAKQHFDAETEKKQREIRRKQAVAQKAQAIAQATISGIEAIMKTLGTTGIFGAATIPILAGISAANIARIIATPVAYAGGGYTDSQGSVTSFQKPTPSAKLAWVNEKGTEYVIPNYLLQQPAIAEMTKMIEAKRINAFADGGYTSTPTPTFSSPSVTTSSPMPSDQRLIDALMLLSSQLDGGIKAYWEHDAMARYTERIEQIKNDSLSQ